MAVHPGQNVLPPAVEASRQCLASFASRGSPQVSSGQTAVMAAGAVTTLMAPAAVRTAPPVTASSARASREAMPTSRSATRERRTFMRGRGCAADLFVGRPGPCFPALQSEQRAGPIEADGTLEHLDQVFELR